MKETAEVNDAVRNGVLASIAWLVFCFVYVIWRNEGFSKFYAMPANEFGDFIAGVSAPVAFGWLIHGFFLQGKQLQLQRTELELQRQELTLQRQEVERLANETAAQRKAIEANELHARRDTFFRLLDLALVDLNYFAARIVSPFVTVDFFPPVWNEMNDGNKNLLFQRTIKLIKDTHAEDVRRGFTGKKVLNERLAPEEQRLAIERFISLAGKILIDAGPADKELRRQLEHSPLGSLLAVLCKFNGQPIPFEYREQPREIHEIV